MYVYMWRYFVFLLAVTNEQGFNSFVTNGTKLISTLLMYRHGDKTPPASSISMSSDPTAVKEACAPYGYGQLTEVGKRRAYSLGMSIRERYNELLSQQYNVSEIYIRSTDSTRVKMSIPTILAAIYPAYPDSWNKKSNWVPVPYTTLLAKLDFNLFNLNYPNFYTAYNALSSFNAPYMDKYQDVLDVITEVSDYNLTLTSSVMMVFQFYDFYVTQVNLGVPLHDKIAAIMPKLKEAAGEAIDILLGNDNYLPLQAGPILNEFFTQADNLIAGIDTTAVRIHSAHDFTVYSFEAAAHVYPRQGAPSYTAAFALELRQVLKSNEYVVLAVYQANPGDGWIYRTADACDILCPYNTYKELVTAYVLDENTWRTKCGFTEDLEVDESSLV